MSTANKLTYLNETKKKIKNTINYAGAGIASDTFRSYPETLYNTYADIINGGTEDLFNEIPHVTGSGTNLSLNNSAECKMQLNLKGNTSQETTTGKNIFSTQDYFDYQVTSTMISNNELKVTSTGTSTRRGVAVYPLDTNGNKILVSNILNKVIRIKTKMVSSTFDTNKPCYVISRGNGGAGTQDMVKSNISENTIDYTFTSNNATYPYLCFYFMHSDSGGSVAVGNETTFSNIIVTLDNSNMDFEPYTNGQSPNPDYPQDIHVVSGDNIIEICGENLFNISKAQVGKNWNGDNMAYSISSDYINVSPSEIYSLSVENMSNYTKATLVELDENDNYILSTSNFTSKELYSDTRKIKLSLRCDSSHTWTQTELDNAKIMFNKGNITTFKPYPTSYSINLPVENLFDKDNATSQVGYFDSSGNIISGGGSTVTTSYTSIIPNTDMTISGIILERIVIYDKDKNFIGRINYSGTDNIRTINKNAYFIRFQSSTPNFNIDNVQIEKGTKANTYTPYGTTPIEMCKIGTYQDKIDKSTGKNLFDKDNANILSGAFFNNNLTTIGTNTYSKILYIPCETNTTYTIQKIKSARFGVCTTNTTPALNVNIYNIKYSDIALNLTITTDSNSKYICVFYYKSDVDTLSEQTILDSIMINEGSTALPYEPYGTSWYVKKEIGKELIRPDTATIENNGVRTNAFVPKPIEAYPLLFCNYFGRAASYNGATNANSTTPNKLGFNSNGQTICNILGYTTTTEYIDFFANNEVYAYYIKAIPTYTKITDTTLANQLEDIYKAKSYNNQTNISQISADLPFVVDATAALDYDYIS